MLEVRGLRLGRSAHFVVGIMVHADPAPWGCQGGCRGPRERIPVLTGFRVHSVSAGPGGGEESPPAEPDPGFDAASGWNCFGTASVFCVGASPHGHGMADGQDLAQSLDGDWKESTEFGPFGAVWVVLLTSSCGA